MFKQILFERGSSFIDDEEELTNGGLYETFRLFHFNKYFIFNFFFKLYYFCEQNFVQQLKASTKQYKLSVNVAYSYSKNLQFFNT